MSSKSPTLLSLLKEEATIFLKDGLFKIVADTEKDNIELSTLVPCDNEEPVTYEIYDLFNLTDSGIREMLIKIEETKEYM